MSETELSEDWGRRSAADFVNTAYTQRDEVHWTVVEGRGVLVDVENDTYFSLNRSATVAWEVLANESPVAKAVDAICARFAVSREVAEVDIRALVQRLLEEKLICPRT